jgi:TPR repeat protein
MAIRSEGRISVYCSVAIGDLTSRHAADLSSPLKPTRILSPTRGHPGRPDGERASVAVPTTDRDADPIRGRRPRCGDGICARHEGDVASRNENENSLGQEAAQMTEEDWAAARLAHQRGDYATALTLYRALAEQGSARAQDNLGVMYESGLGVPKSHAEALKWYRLAAAQGNRDAQNNLGVMYEYGHGVPRDPAEAVQWYRKAAAQGDTNAQHNLGNAYQSGLGVAQDHAEALAWYRRAAAARHPMAQANLGVMFEHGHGVGQDLIEAHKWYTLSAMTFRASEAKNRGLVVRNRDQLVARMTPAEIEEARRRAREWRPK